MVLPLLQSLLQLLLLLQSLLQLLLLLLPPLLPLCRFCHRRFLLLRALCVMHTPLPTPLPDTPTPRRRWTAMTWRCA